MTILGKKCGRLYVFRMLICLLSPSVLAGRLVVFSLGLIHLLMVASYVPISILSFLLISFRLFILSIYPSNI